MNNEAWRVTLNLSPAVRDMARRTAQSDREEDLLRSVEGMIAMACLLLEEFCSRTDLGGRIN